MHTRDFQQPQHAAFTLRLLCVCVCVAQNQQDVSKKRPKRSRNVSRNVSRVAPALASRRNAVTKTAAFVVFVKIIADDPALHAITEASNPSQQTKSAIVDYLDCAGQLLQITECLQQRIRFALRDD